MVKNSLSRIVRYDSIIKHAIDLKQDVAQYGFDLSDSRFLQINNLESDKLVVLLGGGLSDEREISYKSCAAVLEALLTLQYKVIFIDIGVDIINILTNIKTGFRVFNLIHGKLGEDGWIQSVLNVMKIPYTGSGVLASSCLFNKKIAYMIARANGIKINDFIILDKNNLQPAVELNIKAPFVIKPLSQGSSIGVEIIDDYKMFDPLKYDFKYGNQVIIEPYIKGQELQVVMFDNKILGILEIKLLLDKKLYDYETKYNIGFAEHIYPPEVNNEIVLKIFDISKKIYSLFYCKGLVRLEFLYQKETGCVYFLEGNTNPGMTNKSICPEIASYKGINFVNLVDMILKDSSYEQ